MKKKLLSIVSATVICMSAVSMSGAVIASGETDSAISYSDLNWLPTTMSEYNDFVIKHGKLSVHDNYIVYCDEINYSVGDEVILEQLGTAKIKEIKHYGVATDEPVPIGSKHQVVYVYEAISPGTITVTISQGRTWDSSAPKEEKAVEDYKVNEDLSIEEINNTIKGDVNADGLFNISDVVLLQKWLVNIPDTKLSDWKAADLCEDSKLDVFDLCMMKRVYISQTTDMD